MQRFPSSWQNVLTKLGFSSKPRRRTTGGHRRGGSYSRRSRLEPLEDRRLLALTLSNGDAMAYALVPGSDDDADEGTYDAEVLAEYVLDIGDLGDTIISTPEWSSEVHTVSSGITFESDGNSTLIFDDDTPNHGLPGGGIAWSSQWVDFYYEDPTTTGYLEVRCSIDSAWDVDFSGDPSHSATFDFSAYLSVDTDGESYTASVTGGEDGFDPEGGGYYNPAGWWLTVDFGSPVEIDSNHTWKTYIPISDEDHFGVSALSEISTEAWLSSPWENGLPVPASGTMDIESYGNFDVTFIVHPDADPEDVTPPRVTDVIISETDAGYSHQPYSFDDNNADGSGEQLRTVPVGGANTVTIEFSEDVYLLEEDLSIIGLRTGTQPTVADFSVTGNLATWVFDTPLAAEQYLIKLSDWVCDNSMNSLDGEWHNPASLTTSYNSAYDFPSGNGVAGGDFEFVFNILPADFNRDLSVDIADLAIYRTWGGSGMPAHGDGDANGDGSVDIADLAMYRTSPFSTELCDLAILADLDSDYDVDATDQALYNANPVDFDHDYTAGDDDDDAIMAAFAEFGIDLDVFS